MRFLSLGVAILAGAAPMAAQKQWVMPRTPDGHPDLQGNWTNATLTPIERMPGLGAALTPQQVTAFETGRKSRIDSLSQKSDPNRGAPPAGGVRLGDPAFDAAAGGTGGYNVFFIDPGDRIAVIRGEARSSIVTRPASGKVPPRTAAGQRRAAAEMMRFGNFDNPENRPLAERCIISFGSNAGPPMLPNYFYNNNYTIVQTPGYILIFTEMVHDARIIRMADGAPAPSSIQPYMGDSRGHWAGDTLVIETTNLNPAQAGSFYGASPKMKVTERITRVDETTLDYEFLIDDPDSFTESWGGELPFRRLDERLYEYACHEGNYALGNVLSGARDEERRKAAKKPKGE